MIYSNFTYFFVLSVSSSHNSYGTSPLMNVQTKVDQVQNVMTSSVHKALANVETIEEMDEKAELFEDQSKRFAKRAEGVQSQEKWKYRKLTIIICLAVL